MDDEIEVLSLDDNDDKKVTTPEKSKKGHTKVLVVPKRKLRTETSNDIDKASEKTVIPDRKKVLVIPPRIMHPLVYKERSEELIKSNIKEKHPKTKKKNRVWLVILMLIVIVIIFGSFYFLPKIDKYINIKYLNGTDEKEDIEPIKEETNEKVETDKKSTSAKTPFNESLARTFTCNKNGIPLTDNINYSSNALIYYIGIKVKKIKITTTEVFAVKNDTYNQLVQSCTTTIPLYNDRDGYKSTCMVNDNTVIINTEYDLTVFSTIKESDITIKAPFALDTKIAKIKAIYSTTGYTCD